MKYILFFLFLISSTYVFSQKIHINETEGITKLMVEYKYGNSLKKDIQGYRIQLIATTERRLMESTKAKFSRDFPHIKSRWNHKSPYYQVQVGAYPSKQEALPDLGQVKKKFPKAYLIVDRITMNEVLATL